MLQPTPPAGNFTFQPPSPLSVPLEFGAKAVDDEGLPNFSQCTREMHNTERPSARFTPRKKSRLRLQFVTSPLSEPYSAPASYIVDRGNCRVATWAKYRPLSRSWLRKRAILNSVNRSLGTDPEFCVTDSLQPFAVDALDGQVISAPATQNFLRRHQNPNASTLHGYMGNFNLPRLLNSPNASTSSPSNYNYNALDEDYQAKYVNEEDDEGEEYIPHPDFAINKVGQSSADFKSPLPSPSPSPPSQPLTILPTGYRPGHRTEAGSAPEPISPLYIQPGSGFEERMRAWLQADRRPPSPPEEEMLNMIWTQDSMFGLR